MHARPQALSMSLALALALASLAPPALTDAMAQQSGDIRPAGVTPASSGQAVAVSAGTLDTYVGTYEISPGFDLQVWREGDGLALQATGQAAWPLQAISETRFRVQGQPADVTFVHDAAGAVGLLVLDMDGRQMRALRL